MHPVRSPRLPAWRTGTLLLVAAVAWLVSSVRVTVEQRPARAEVIASSGSYLKHLVGTGILAQTNVSSVANPSTGTYTVGLASPCSNTLGVAVVTISRADGSCFAEYTTTSQVTVTCRSAATNALTNIPAGTTVQLAAFCGR